MAKLKCSTYFPNIFSKFSSNFLQLFQMTEMKCFQHRSTNVCKNTVKVKAAFCSNEFLLCQKCVIFWLHGFCVSLSYTCCGNVLETSHMTSRVCVYRRNFSAICCLSLEYDHLRAYTSRKGECHNNNAETPSRHSSAEVNEASNS